MSDLTIIKRIGSDLKIGKSSEEKKSQFFSRIVYSALSMWIRISTLDEDIFQQNLEKVGVSKVHILNRCQPFLENMIEIYPEIMNWFYPVDIDEHPISLIRERLHSGGELVDVGFNTDLALPYYEECKVDERIRLVRGIQAGDFQKVSGLVQVVTIQENIDTKMRNAIEFYGLQDKLAIQHLHDYLKLIKWNRRKESKVQILNKYSSNVFSNSWEDECKLKDSDISMYRSPFYDRGNKDFGFIKKMNGSIYTSQINEYLINQFEIRRFIYGLKSEANNPVRAKFKKHMEVQLVELNLFNSLPLKEEKILLLLGWPIKNINDKHNLIFDMSIWVFVVRILSNLNISLEEVI